MERSGGRPVVRGRDGMTESVGYDGTRVYGPLPGGEDLYRPYLRVRRHEDEDDKEDEP